MDDERIVVVEITVRAKPFKDGTAENLKASVDEYFIRRAQKFPPDSRFDWETAQCYVSEIEKVRTPPP